MTSFDFSTSFPVIGVVGKNVSELWSRFSNSLCNSLLRHVASFDFGTSIPVIGVIDWGPSSHKEAGGCN